jgi:hypothetical protein
MKAVRKLVYLSGILSLLLAGCESAALHNSAPAMSLQTTRDNLLVNESTTVLVKSENTLGTHPSIQWSTTLGKVTPVKEGMLDFRPDKPTAIFTSDAPGEAIVTATLTMDDGKTLSDSVKIVVNPTR